MARYPVKYAQTNHYSIGLAQKQSTTIILKLTQSHLEKEESEEQSKATVTDSADKTKVLCQTQQTEQGFCRNHITNINNSDQRRISQHHNNSAINYNYFNYPYTQNNYSMSTCKQIMIQKCNCQQYLGTKEYFDLPWKKHISL